jgi:hypothetical protein
VFISDAVTTRPHCTFTLLRLLFMHGVTVQSYINYTSHLPLSRHTNTSTVAAVTTYLYWDVRGSAPSRLRVNEGKDWRRLTGAATTRTEHFCGIRNGRSVLTICASELTLITTLHYTTRKTFTLFTCFYSVFENVVLRRLSRPKRDEVTGEWRRLHKEEL